MTRIEGRVLTQRREGEKFKEGLRNILVEYLAARGKDVAEEGGRKGRKEGGLTLTGELLVRLESELK